MNELPSLDPLGPEPEGTPQPSKSEELVERPPAAEPKPRNRGLLWSLTVLYALSVLAAGTLVWRSQPKEEGPKVFKAPVLLGKKDVVGLVSIYGPIYPPEGGVSFGRGVPQWTRAIRKMAEKKEVRAIVLDINSPGGTVGSVQELHSLIKRMRRENGKPFVALLGDVAASGGYYVACACDKIVSHPGSLVGSIGVIFHTTNMEGLLGKIGVKSDAIKSGKMKDIGSPTRPMTLEERALLQSLINDSYDQFLKAVAEGRSLPVDRVRPLADGRIFTGRQGMEVGLVDQVGDEDDALALAGKLGGITGKPSVLRDTDSILGVLSMLESRLAMALSPEAALLSEVRGWTSRSLEYRWAY